MNQRIDVFSSATLQSPAARVMSLVRRLLRWLADRSPPVRRLLGERALRRRYRRLFGAALDFRHPVGFTDELFAAMIANNRCCDPLLTRLTDKLAVRRFVAGRIGERYLAAQLWHGDDPAAIPFDRLPTAFVAKTNHSCDTMILVNGVPDRAAIVARLAGWLEENYYWRFHEAQYHGIRPAVLIEEHLGLGPQPLITCRCWCFHGRVALVQVDGAIKGVTNFYDPAWRLLDLQYRRGQRNGDFARPATLDEILRLASRLASGFAFVRVDLYTIGDAIYFNEMTFTPAGGKLFFSPPQWDLTLGMQWQRGWSDTSLDLCATVRAAGQ